MADLQAWGPAESTRNILGYLWSKLAFSSMLAATALVDAPMADLIDRHRELMLAIAGEVFDLAYRYEVSLESFDAFDPTALAPDSKDRDAGIDRLVAWLRGQTKTRSGVWRDLAVHRRMTEAALRYTDVIQLRDSLGATSPHLEALVAMLREIESGRRDMTDENLHTLERDTSAVRDL
ncbi:MAG: ketopantoate reductase family protein [Gemmatimonadaceae bacterium]